MPRNTKMKSLGATLKTEAEVEGLKAEVQYQSAEVERLKAVLAQAQGPHRQDAIDTAVATERLLWRMEVEQLKAEVVRTAVAAVAEERSLCLREIDNAFFAATAAKAIRTRAAKRSSATTPVKQ
jgi:hypothetical protein